MRYLFSGTNFTGEHENKTNTPINATGLKIFPIRNLTIPAKVKVLILKSRGVLFLCRNSNFTPIPFSKIFSLND